MPYIVSGFKTPRGSMKIRADIVTQKAFDDRFMVEKQVLKDHNFKWDPETKAWTTTVGQYAINEETLKTLVKTHENKSALDMLESFRKVTDLKTLPMPANVDYDKLTGEDNNGSHYKPIVGKAPFETFQDEDIKRALSQNRFLFSWGTGCGKSFALAILIEWRLLHGEAEKFLVFTSPEGVYNLKSELLKFCKDFKPEDIVVITCASDLDKLTKTDKKHKATRKIFDFYNPKILIVSYDAWKPLNKAYDDNVPLEAWLGKDKSKWFLALDEVHKLANPTSERSKSILKYALKFNYRYLFTATLADKNQKLYVPSLLLDPKLVYCLSWSEWKCTYNELGTRFSKYAINDYAWHEDLLNELKQSLLDYSVKRNAKDVLEIPELIQMPAIRLSMDREHMHLYERVASYIVSKSLDDASSSGGSIDEAILKQFSTVASVVENPYVFAQYARKKNIAAAKNDEPLIPEELIESCEQFNYRKHFAKLPVLKDIVSSCNEDGARGIVWYTHPATLEILRDELKKYDPVIVSAEASKEERAKLVDEFKRDASHKLLIASVYILNTSVTITEATYLIYYENTYNYTDYIQSMGRAYRIGQQEQVKVYNMYYNDSTDYFLENAIQKKQTLLTSLLNDRKTFDKVMFRTKSDIASFFKPKD